MILNRPTLPVFPHWAFPQRCIPPRAQNLDKTGGAGLLGDPSLVSPAQRLKSQSAKAVSQETAFVQRICKMYFLWCNTIFHYALWFFIVFLIMIYHFFNFSLKFAHFNPCSFLTLYVFVLCLLSLPPLFLGYSIARIYPVPWPMSMR